MDDPTATGVTSAVVSLVATGLVTLIVRPPWGSGTILLGVGITAFVTGYVVREVSG
ncbi:MAG: hypothetical protein ABEI99_05780 [Halobaculum sp.]